MVKKILLFCLFMLVPLTAQADVLIFVSDWCSACVPMKQIALELQYEGYDVKIINDVNVAKKYRVTTVPTIVFRNGESEIYRHVGQMSKEELKRRYQWYVLYACGF